MMEKYQKIDIEFETHALFPTQSSYQQILIAVDSTNQQSSVRNK